MLDLGSMAKPWTGPRHSENTLNLAASKCPQGCLKASPCKPERFYDIDRVGVVQIATAEQLEPNRVRPLRDCHLMLLKNASGKLQALVILQASIMIGVYMCKSLSSYALRPLCRIPLQQLLPD